MTRTTSPAPWGVPGLEFGNTTESPYNAWRPHGGQDHQWRYADPARSRQVVASVPGVVTAAYRDGGNHFGWGNYVDITVPTTDGSSVMARLAHHDTVSVRVGQRINAGDPVGVMGDTGEAGGVHLHEELWINGRRVDPIYYRTHDIPGTAGATAGDGASPFQQKEWDEMATKDEIKAAFREVLAEAQNLGPYSLIPMADDGHIYLVNNETRKRVHVETTEHVRLIMRRLSNKANDSMLQVENDIVDGYLAKVS